MQLSNTMTECVYVNEYLTLCHDENSFCLNIAMLHIVNAWLVITNGAAAVAVVIIIFKLRRQQSERWTKSKVEMALVQHFIKEDDDGIFIATLNRMYGVWWMHAFFKTTITISLVILNIHSQNIITIVIFTVC